MDTRGQTRTALITGASSGIGLELTRAMLAEGWEIIALIRSGFPEDDALLRESLGTKRLRVYKAELTDFGGLRHALERIKTREEKIDLLFNNAGGSFPELGFSKQGRELHFELQTVVPYILYRELKELLLRGQSKTVINTSTSAFRLFRRFDPDTLEHPASFRKLFGPYATSKLALSLWTREEASLAASEGIRLLSVDPGGNNTLRSGKASGLPFYVEPLMKFFFPHPRRGASRLYDAAVDMREGLSGAFLSNGRVTNLPFPGEGRRVLEKVRALYEQEFLPTPHA
ncbi:SDR family NAD(P)-dependent oxidoreductase [Vitiosangium sp. GDMCC 1.1324]|uniref:SDR family NAD(P)-dependent oxidoreductase n=1 Tax=Vitiosangium sp. (strain GDMCC 1.1324) TaxID=2138576 RepID=UPI000D39783F|nr:SDR family NAD(P)-dependent oxidoreductase [Vitiosangium sp. GDMCC 1.1324]PTL74949.1 short-chain dehydrogenase [Vitiosangium sp. GDMCC 1.1324]